MVPDGAKACPGCGSDEKTGWQPESFMSEEADFEPELYGHESESGGWLNIRKHPVITLLFFLGVAVLTAVWVIHMVF